MSENRAILFFVFVFFSGGLRAGIVLPDSLKAYLEKGPKDSAYIVGLNKLAFSCLKSSPEDGRELAARAIEFSRNINFKRGLARALDVTGSSYWVIGDYESALKYYQLSAAESRLVRDSVGLSSIYHNIGEVYKKLGDYDKSIELLNQSLTMDAKANNHYGITLYNIGEAYMLKDDYGTASGYFKKSLERGLGNNEKRTIAYSYQGLGIIEYKKRNLKGALDYFTKAEKMWTAQGEFRSLIQTYKDFADVYIQLGNEQKAINYLDKAIAISAKIHAPDLQIINYKKLSDLLAAKGDYKRAFDVTQKYNALKDSVYNLKKSESIRRLQTEFETEAREAENQQLKAEQQLKNSLINSQRKLLYGTLISLVISALLVWFLFRQRKRISEANKMLSTKSAKIELQKNEIETQASTLQQLNEKLQNLNRNLEYRIEERTHQLIRQNQKLAAYAHANAHQLRAPVASILGLLTLLDRIELSEDDKDLVVYLQKCGKELDKITRDIGKDLEEENLIPLAKEKEVKSI